MAEALYRKYRPQTFGDVVGQDHIERTLRNAIEQDKVSHAYLFCGPRGTGKTTTARLLAKALLCEKAPTPDPDGSCPECQAIAAGEHPDVYELDAASRTGVENVREEIIGRVQFAPTRGAKKIYIIDEVHMLSTAAFNALLKTLEEPPNHVVFILCTTDPQKVPETIHSRCQRFDFRRIASEEMVTRLGAICMAEEVEFEGDALDLIAHRAEGGMRNALTALEQAIAYGEGKVTLETVESLVGSLDTNELAQIVSAIGRRDVPACFAWTAAYVETGADLAQFTRDLAEHVRTMYVLSIVGPDAPADVSDAERREIAEELSLFGPDRLARMLAVLGDLSAELKSSTNMRLSFEIALTRMVRPEADLTLAALAERIEELERRLASGGAVPTVAAVPPAAGGTAATSDAGAAPALSAMQPTGSAAERAISSEDTGRTENPMPSPATEGPSAEEGFAPPASGSAATESHSPSSNAPVNGVPITESLAAKLANPAALQRAWQAALAAIKREKAAYAVLLVTAQAAFDVSSRTLSVVFPVESAFAFKAVQRPEVVEALGNALAEAFGERIAFSFVQGASTASGASGEEPSAFEAAAPTVEAGASPSAHATGSPATTDSLSAEGDAAVASESCAKPAETSSPDAPSESSVAAATEDPLCEHGLSEAEPFVDASDEVPVDLYDDAGWSSPASSSPASSSPASSASAAPDRLSSIPRNDDVAPAAAEKAESDSGSAAGFEKAELESLLSASFGDDVVIEEV